MTNNMQDLEDRIMNCWSVVDDIKEIFKSELVKDDRTLNVLLGLVELYQIKFENLWSTYEAALSEYNKNKYS